MRKLLILAILLTALPGDAGQTDGPAAVPFPTAGILPKTETGALRFLKANPEDDGRGIVVAIFDSGIDPGAPGLARTTTGAVKILDIIDGTGAGDVAMSDLRPVKDGNLISLTDRELTIPASWPCPSGEYRLGVKAGFEFYPEDLLPRLKDLRRKKFEVQHREILARVLDEVERHSGDKDEFDARIEALNDAWESFDDPGPVFDCVTFYDGHQWRAAIDTDEDGDLADEKLLTDYAKDHQFATFDDDSRLNFSVKLYDQGKTLSIVTVSDEHGTHVAGIVAAHEPDRPDWNGLAPGAQLVSIRIGDPRLQGMESGAALLRALQAVREHNCQLVNMSFGEPTTTPDRGDLAERMNQLVREHNVIFLSSAGNSGPALSTVGAPGGTNSPLIGVGAYVSPAMMDVEYSLRGIDEEIAYTWTSRGPTTDGDWGVDLLAPGGAISPVPNYSMQPGRQMHGTSMSSPNACGNIALMLSALKRRNETYTPTSILRSLQSTALPVATIDRFAQGPGLVQIDRALEHHLRWGAAPGQQVELSVTIPQRGEARGILLRESHETDREFAGTLSISPRFADSISSSARLKFQLPLRLSATADWVHVGQHLLLAHDGDWIPVRVDPRKLSPGLHIAEIQAFDPEHPERGPLVSVPVTVIRSEAVGREGWTERVKVSPQSVSRHFLAVPAGAQAAKISVRRRDAAAPRQFSVHLVQLNGADTFEDHEFNDTLRLAPAERWETTMPVLAERTLEVCLAQYWSSPGESQLDVEVEFRGLHVSEEELLLAGDGTPAKLIVRSLLQHQALRPEAKLTHWRHTLSPQSSKFEQLTAERDSLWDAQRVQRLLLEYEFSLSEQAKVQIICPRLRNLLYDSPVSSLRMIIRDANGFMVKLEDSYPEEVELAAGDYTIQAELRATERKTLEEYKQLALMLERELEDAIDVPVADTPAEAATAAGDSDETLPFELELAGEQRLLLSLPIDLELPDDFAAGDELTGLLTLDEGRESTVNLTASPKPAAESANDTADEETEDLLQAELEFCKQRLMKLDWDRDQLAIGYLLRRMESLKPDDRAGLMAKLHLLDTEDGRESRLKEVIAAAEAVIAVIDIPRLQMSLGIRHEKSDKSPERRARQQDHDDLIDALYRKARAIAFQDLPEVKAEHPVTDEAELEQNFEAAYTELAKWVDIEEEKWFLLYLRRERRHERYGTALKRLNEALKDDVSKELWREKRVELYEELGWEAWRTHEQHWFWRHFPQEPAAF